MNNQEIYGKIHDFVRGTNHMIFIDDEGIFVNFSGNKSSLGEFYERLWIKQLSYSDKQIQEIASLPKEELDMLVKLVKVKNLRKQADEIESSITI